MTRFTDDLGYARCPVCEEQIPASLWCDPCNAYAWEHPPAVTLEEWKIRWDISDDGKSGRIAA